VLVELAIENLGVIESVRLTFEDGFTALTGETGAGKTLLIEAINLVVGRRADVGVIRDGANEARVEARFIHTVDNEEVETILCRVLSREGRSRAYINDRMATVTTLSDIGETLVDIHGQHSHQRLMSPQVQRESLDRFAKIDLTELRLARDHVAEIGALLGALGGDEKSRVREIDLLSFQCEEIEGARITDAGEDEHLSQEQDNLSDVARLRDTLWAVSSLLSDDDAVTDQLGTAVHSTSLVPGLAPIHERLAQVLAETRDIAHTVRGAAESADEDPERLEQIRLRRQVLHDLKRKYGDSLSDVLGFGVLTRTRLDELIGYSVRVAELEAARETAMTTLLACQHTVGNSRRGAANALAEGVQERLRVLALPHAEVVVSVGDASSDPSGESVVFMLAANPGSPPQPISKVASGGELARVMLALRLVLTDDPATMVFDEVDAGIGGAAAVAVATALRELGDTHQVFAVTHLAQVAASAHSQVSVSKRVKSGKTFGAATVLLEQDRASEIARMLSGGIADESAMAHAQDLLSSLGSGSQRHQRRG